MTDIPGIGSAAPDASTYDWTSHVFTEKAVICFIRKDGKLLLIHKRRGLGAGKINGPGGRLEPGETPREAAVRETAEEVCLVPERPEPRAELSFLFIDGYSLFVTVFLASGFTGTPCTTDEAVPFWCDESEIPYDRMWEDDIYWLPHVLDGKFVRGFFVFDGDSMISRTVTTD